MKLGIVGIFVGQPYKKLIYGWTQNMYNLLLPGTEREWYIWTDEPEHPDLQEALMPLHIFHMPIMSKVEVWRKKFTRVEEACAKAKADGCTHLIFAQSNVRCCRKIDAVVWGGRMEMATDGSPCSIRHIPLRGTDVQCGLFWGKLTTLETVVSRWREKCEDDAWWKQACEHYLYDEYLLSEEIAGGFKGMLGHADYGFSHDLLSDTTWRWVPGDPEDRVMCTVNKKGYLGVNIFGGLGNALFEVAYALNLAKKLGMKPVLSYSDLAKRYYAWLGNSALKSYFGNRDAIPPHTLRLIRLPVVAEDVTFFEPYNANILGCVQGYEGFKESEKEVRAIFSSFTSVHKIPHSIGLHIRGGDYLLYPYPRPNPEKIASILSRYKEGYTIYVFTNDEKYGKEVYAEVRKRLDFEPKVVWAIGSRNVNDCFQDFSLMTSMEVFICSASTFSWWAAFLGRPKKVYWPNTKGEGSGSLGYFYRLKMPDWEWIEKKEEEP